MTMNKLIKTVLDCLDALIAMASPTKEQIPVRVERNDPRNSSNLPF